MASNGYSQSIEITPSYGYQFGTKLNYGPNYLKMKDSDQFGVTLGYETYDDMMIEVSYIHQGTELRIRDNQIAPIESRVSDLAVDWIQIGSTRYFTNDNIKPFFGAGLGVAIFSPKNENYDVVNRALNSSTEFAFSFKTGVNIMFSEHVGLNLQGNLMFPVQWGGFYVSGGSGGVSSGASVSSTTIIGGFSGGLVFRN
jgi:outer membrane protein W